MFSIRGKTGIISALAQSQGKLFSVKAEILKLYIYWQIKQKFYQKYRPPGPWDHKNLVSVKTGEKNLMLVYL
jgi:hypothetical protein